MWQAAYYHTYHADAHLWSFLFCFSLSIYINIFLSRFLSICFFVSLSLSLYFSRCPLSLFRYLFLVSYISTNASSIHKCLSEMSIASHRDKPLTPSNGAPST